MNYVKISHIPTDECPYRWAFVYLHGRIEEEVEYDYERDIVPDIGYFSEPLPKEAGFYLGSYNDEPVIINFVSKSHGGRACFLNDNEAIEHVLCKKDWG